MESEGDYTFFFQTFCLVREMYGNDIVSNILNLEYLLLFNIILKLH